VKGKRKWKLPDVKRGGFAAILKEGVKNICFPLPKGKEEER